MAYSNSPGPAAGADLESSTDGGDDESMPDESQTDPAEAGEGEDAGTFYLPSEFTAKYDCKPGDKITLEVVDVDQDGDKEVKIVGVNHGSGKKGLSMMEDLRASKDKIMPDSTGETSN